MGAATRYFGFTWFANICLLFACALQLVCCSGPCLALVNQPLADRTRMHSIEWRKAFSIVTINI
jgi:hypothetical protein